MVDRFVFGDAPVEEVVLDLEAFTGEEGLAADVGRLANDLASDMAKRRRESLGQ
jgi:hypothetical protein